MQSILVIGVGRFGKHLAKTMLDLGNDIVIVDKNEEKVFANCIIYSGSSRIARLKQIWTPFFTKCDFK